MNIRRIFLFISISLAGVMTSCKDQNAIVDINQEIPERTWTYIDKIKVPVSIPDASKAYNVYLNLRHSGDYKYSNIFILVHEISPDHKTITERKEIKLALPDGEWLGKGSGNLYSYQVLIKSNYHFAKKGTYVFQLEQNMRDNPLREVTDAGLRVELAN
ncbi:MAG: gldH [Daejeonella sp.]|nr:gldH [Daejeonella sp.]